MKDFSRHLKEAIEINTERLPLYAKLSNGKSIKYSRKLIAYEKMSLLFAAFYDRIGDRYQKNGIDFLKSEFVSMDLIPDFSETFPENIEYNKALQIIDIVIFKRALNKLIKERKFEGIVNLCNEKLNELEKQAHVYCMLRHIIESVRRIAFLIPIHEEKCKLKGIKPPTKYSVQLLRSHSWLLNTSKKLDEDIAPIQQLGIPILFQDLPHIDLKIS